MNFKKLCLKKPFIIAEAGVNHNGDFDLTRNLVDIAKEAGADAVKFQIFKSENLVTKDAPMAKYQIENLNKSETQLQMLKKLELDYRDYPLIKDYCDHKNIIFLSTAHTEDGLDLINPLVPMHKIGSGDLTNHPFLKKVAQKGKPIILGTGMATMNEVKEALKVIYGEGNKDVVMLHCTTNYPCPKNEVNLRAMQTMQKELDCLVGYSDHTLGLHVPLIAARLGAVVIEKHFTINRNMEGPDHKASLEPVELKAMVDLIRQDKLKDSEIMGSPEKKPTKSEIEIAKIARKSIVSRMRISKGTVITNDMLIIKRPGTGFPAKYLNKIIGRKAKRDIQEDKLLKKGDVS